MPISVITLELVNELIQAHAHGQINKLNLSENYLSVVENLGALTRLQKLDLSRNKFTGELRSIGGLASLQSLVELDLSSNAIQELKCLGAALGPLVKHLSLKNNKIEDLEQLQHLGGLHSLEILELEGNSIVKEGGYRKYIANTLPWLQVLDGESLRPASTVKTSVESSIYQDQPRIVSEGKLPVFNSQCDAEGAAPPSMSMTDTDDGNGNERLFIQPDLLPISTEPVTGSATENDTHVPGVSLAIDSTVHPVSRIGLAGSCSSAGEHLLNSKEQRRDIFLEIQRENTASVTGNEKCMPPNPWRKASSHHHPFIQEGSVDEILAPASTITSSSDASVHDLAHAAASRIVTAPATAELLKSTPNDIIPSQQLHPSPPQLPLHPPQSIVTMTPSDPVKPLPGTLPTRPPPHGMKNKAVSPLERSRQTSISSSNNHQPSHGTVNAATCIDERDVKIGLLTKEVDLLSAQNKALRKAITSQHEALVVRHCSSRAQLCPNDSGNKLNSGSLVCDTENDPYAKLLNCWRHEVLQLLTEKEIGQVEQRKHLSEMEESTKKSNQRCIELEKLLLAAESRVDAAEAELALSKDRTNTLSMELSKFQSRCSTFEAEYTRRRDLEVKMLQRLFVFQENINFKYHDNSNGIVSAISRLKGFESRLSVIHSRIQLASALHKQKEVHLRNCRAALEADKRVWYLERERREMAALSDAGAAFMTTENNSHSESCLFRRPNGFVCGLQPECEAAMRTIFCQLDKQGAGEVEWEELIQALRDDSGITVLMTNVLGKQRWAAALASIESQLVEAQVKQLSWGEFLLFFIPKRSRSKVPVWREIDESLPTLQLVVPPAYRTGATLPTTDDLTTQELRKEVRRLCQERTFLMETLREESTAFMHRSEDVYELFRNELRVAYRNAETSKTEATAVHDELSIELRKVKELQYSLKEEKTKQHRSEEAWKQRFQLNSAAQESSLKLAEKEFRKKIDAEKDRIVHLNEEISLLRQDLAKANIAKQSLERQLSCAKKSAQDSLKGVEEDLCGRIAARDRELTAVRRERNSLLSILRDQQQKGLLKFGATGDIAQNSSVSNRSSSSSDVSSGRNHAKEELG